MFDTLSAAFPRASQGSLRTLAGCFGFPGDEIEKPCRVLSGGEKARLVLAKMLYDPPNFLVLDEPTNHLDIDGIATLEDLLVKVPASIVITIPAHGPNRGSGTIPASSSEYDIASGVLKRAADAGKKKRK